MRLGIGKWRAVVLLVVVAAGGIGYLLVAREGPSRCAMLYAETGEERFRGASAWTCYWARLRRGIQQEEIAKRDHASADLGAKEKEAAGVRAQQEEANLIDELRTPVCSSLLKWRLSSSTGPAATLEVDLVGLAGHSSIYSIQEVCRDCPDLMWTYWDVTGARFCTAGGIGGKPCSELKQFPHNAGAHREGTADALWTELDCR